MDSLVDDDGIVYHKQKILVKGTPTYKAPTCYEYTFNCLANAATSYNKYASTITFTISTNMNLYRDELPKTPITQSKKGKGRMQNTPQEFL